MIELRFPPGDTGPGDREVWRYQLLDSELRSNREMMSLGAFAGGNDETMISASPGRGAEEDFSALADGHAVTSNIVVHDHSIRLSSLRTDAGILLALDDHTRIHVSPSREALRVETRSALAGSLLEQLVLGPGLVFLLADRNIHFIHASAIATAGGAVLFVGPSGSGKSTLARALATRNDTWKLLADDIVAIRTGEDTPACLSRFAQPKLPRREQPTTFETAMPLAGIFLVAPVPGDQSARLLDTTAPAGQAVALINHIMGSGTGDPLLERSILAAVSTLVSAVPGGRLEYPHGPDGPAGVQRQLTRALPAMLS